MGLRFPINGTPNESDERPAGVHGLLKLFYVGIGVKRWLLAGSVGIAVCSIGVAFMLRRLFALRFPDFPTGLLGGRAAAGGRCRSNSSGYLRPVPLNRAATIRLQLR